MSKEFTKRVEDDTVIYENSEAKWVFAKARPPHITDYEIIVSAVDKTSRFSVPVTMIMSGKEFRDLLSNLGIVNPNKSF